MWHMFTEDYGKNQVQPRHQLQLVYSIFPTKGHNPTFINHDCTDISLAH